MILFKCDNDACGIIVPAEVGQNPDGQPVAIHPLGWLSHGQFHACGALCATAVDKHYRKLMGKQCDAARVKPALKVIQ